MPDTITSYHTFQANTKARASYVNTNFDNHRGTLVPINTDTATASNLTHSLGTAEHRWAYVAAKELFLGATTASWNTYDSTAAGGDLVFAKSGTEKFRIPASSGITTSASPGQIAKSSDLDVTPISGIGQSANVAGSTLTIQTIGRPVEIELFHNATVTGTGSYIRMQMNNPTATAQVLDFRFRLLRNGSTLASALNFFNPGINLDMGMLPGMIRFRDTPAAGTHTYSLYVANGAAYSTQITFKEVNLQAREM